MAEKKVDKISNRNPEKNGYLTSRENLTSPSKVNKSTIKNPK